MIRNSNLGLRSRTRATTSTALFGAAALTLAGCGLGYVAIGAVALQDSGGAVIDTTQPDLTVSNLQVPAVATLVTVDDGFGVRFFEPVTFNVVNSGDDVAPAGYGVSLFLSATKEINDQSIRFRDITVNTTTQVGEFTRVTSFPEGDPASAEPIAARNLAGTIVGPGAALESLPSQAFVLARVGAVGAITELDATNNDTLAIGRVQIFDPRATPGLGPLPAEIPSIATPRTNFVLERLTVPTFAFAQDAVNAGQQAVGGTRVFDAGIEISVRGAATTRAEDFELELFLSSDEQLDVGSDLPVSAPPNALGIEVDLVFTVPANAPVGQRFSFQNFTVQLPRSDAIRQAIQVSLPQTFFLIGRITPRADQVANPTVASQQGAEDQYDDQRAGETRTRVYDRFLQSDKAVLPDLTVDGTDRTDPDALEFTTTVFSIPTPGSQRIFSFQIPDVVGIDPDESQVLILLNSSAFDPVLDLLSPLGNSLRVSDDSNNGRQSLISAPLSAAGAGNNTFYVAISSNSGAGSGDFNLTIFVQERGDPTKPVIQPLNLGNVLSLDRAQATIRGSGTFPIAEISDGNAFTARLDDDVNVSVAFIATETAVVANVEADQIDDAVSPTRLRDLTAPQVVNIINAQGQGRLRAGVDTRGQFFLNSARFGNDSAIKITVDPNDVATGLLGLPFNEDASSEGSVTFNFSQSQNDTQFLFFVPGLSAVTFSTEPSVDLLGGVTGSLQFFDGISQQNIPLTKASDSAASTVFSDVAGAPLRLARGFYALTFRAPQPDPGSSFRLRLDMRFDRTIVVPAQ